MHKKIQIGILLCFVLLLTGCLYPESKINVISRENGSGTRDAFTSLFELNQENKDGTEKDQTVATSEVTNSTAVVLQTVGEDRNAIGYISMGSLNESVKAVNINQIKPTAENVENGTYPVFRPFILVLNDSSGELEKDFVEFCQSKPGATIIEENGYIPESKSTSEYKPSPLEGKIVINGSSSVTPLVEALSEEYMKVNPQIDVEVQQSDSTTGISSMTEDIADIGMSSRELKPEEINKGLKPVVISYDGLAIIVNNENPVTNLTIDNVHDIYSGKISLWTELGESNGS